MDAPGLKRPGTKARHKERAPEFSSGRSSSFQNCRRSRVGAGDTPSPSRHSLFQTRTACQVVVTSTKRLRYNPASIRPCARQLYSTTRTPEAPEANNHGVKQRSNL